MEGHVSQLKEDLLTNATHYYRLFQLPSKQTNNSIASIVQKQNEKKV
jgi:ribosomal protein S17E